MIYSTYVYQIEFSQVKQRNVLRPRPSHCIGHPRLDLDLARSLGGILHASAHSRGGVTYTPKYSCSLLLYPFLCIHCGVTATDTPPPLTTALSLLLSLSFRRQRELRDEERDGNQRSRNGGGDCNTDLDRINNGDRKSERGVSIICLRRLINSEGRMVSFH